MLWSLTFPHKPNDYHVETEHGYCRTYLANSGAVTQGKWYWCASTKHHKLGDGFEDSVEAAKEAAERALGVIEHGQ